MVVRLRLARHGSKKNPFYHVVAISDKCPRDARPIEKLGEYDPIPRTRPAASPAQAKLQQPTGLFTSGIQPTIESTRLEKRLEWNSDRIKHWLSVGAQPSKPVARLLDRVSVTQERSSVPYMAPHLSRLLAHDCPTLTGWSCSSRQDLQGHLPTPVGPCQPQQHCIIRSTPQNCLAIRHPSCSRRNGSTA